MYSHCIFCKRDLGTNVVLEQFPVGSRLAFDERGGRLWVICPNCERWNLSPLEERWETIEECERQYRRSMRRVNTDHIGLSVHPSGMRLVRIGSPQRPEMAAWRYGDQLLNRRKRHRRSRMWTGSALLMGWPVILVTVAYRSYRERKPLLWAEGTDGDTVRLSGRHAKSMRLVPIAGSWQLEVGPIEHPLVVAQDEEAYWISGQLFPWLNRKGTSSEGVERAVRQIERAGSPAELFHNAATRLQGRQGAVVNGDGLIRRAPEELKLALEMAAHEDLELEAAAGELLRLEAAWRDAEEIARIADGLLIPSSVRQIFTSMRSSLGRNT